VADEGRKRVLLIAAAILASRSREQLTTARLNALKMQPQPHFLFNTLNANHGVLL
jgi:sensor histidine kinase YesM